MPADLADRLRGTLRNVALLDWLTRSDAKRRRAIVPVLFGVVLLGLAGYLVTDVSKEYDDRAILHARGEGVVVSVTEVLDRSRTNDALYVRGKLPDGRIVEVDLADSDQLGAEAGAAVRVTVDPTDLSRNMPTDLFAREDPFMVAVIKYVGPIVLFAVGWFTFGAVIAHNASRRPTTQRP